MSNFISKPKLLLRCLFILIIVLLLSSAVLFAEETTEIKKVQVQLGTKVPITLKQTITSAMNSIGSTVYLTVDSDVLVNGVVVIKKDTLVLGRVNEIQKSRPVNKPGDINFVVSYITAVDGQNLPTEKEPFGNNGKRRTGAMAGNIFLWGVFGLLTKGADAVVPMGTGYDLTVANNNLEINPNKPAMIENPVKPDLKFTSKIDDEILVGSLKESKLDSLLTIDFIVPQELVQLLPKSTNSISIIKISDFNLPRTISPRTVEIKESKNTIKMAFSWWEAIQYCQAGETSWDILFKLSDGRVAVATVSCNFKWQKQQ